MTFDSRDVTMRFVEEHGLAVPIIADAQDYIDRLGVTEYPTLVLVSPEGRLVAARSSYSISSEPGGKGGSIERWIRSLGL